MSSCPDAISLPAHLVEQAHAFSIDFGGSVIKIAYKLAGEAQDEDGKSLIYLTQYPRAKLQDALVFIRDTVPLPTNGEQQEITMTGVGTFEHQATIEKELGIKVKTVWEGECTFQMFHYLLSSQSDEELYFPPLAVHDESTDLLTKGMKVTAGAMGASKMLEVEPWDYNEHRKWPCLSLVLGSAFLFNPVTEDGATSTGTFIPQGGRAFHGLGSLLTGAKTFEELIALAEAGDDHSVNIYGKDMVKEPSGTKTDDAEKTSPEDDAYSGLELDFNLFSYGWAVGKTLDDFKKEDVARALLTNVCASIIQYARLVANKLQISNMVVFGGFAMNPFIRCLLEREFVYVKAVEEFFPFCDGMKHTTFRTMKVGSHLGALGTMFSDVDFGGADKQN